MKILAWCIVAQWVLFFFCRCAKQFWKMAKTETSGMFVSVFLGWLLLNAAEVWAFCYLWELKP